MAKALIGHLPTEHRTITRVLADNDRLRRRVEDLEALVGRLQRDNDRLTALQAAALLEDADLTPEPA